MVLAEHSYYALLGTRRLGQLTHSLGALARDWVRVRVAYCGVCGSDLSKYLGLRRATFPLPMGHEWVGVVEGVGSDVRTVALGDVVTTDLNHRCGSCPQCQRGKSHLCRQGQVGLFSNRGFAEILDIHVGYLQKCRSGPVPQLALAEPLSCALHALAHVQPGTNDRVLVIGAGSIGLCASFALCNGRPIGAFDVTDINHGRLSRLEKALEPVGRAVSEVTEQYDVVMDVSGTATGLRAACVAVSPGGRLCTVSHLPDHADISFLLDILIHKDATLAISYLNGSVSTMVAAIRLLETNWTPTWKHLIEVRPLSDLKSVFAQRSASSANKVVIDVSGSTARQ